jgi:hypothetical protein
MTSVSSILSEFNSFVTISRARRPAGFYFIPVQWKAQTALMGNIAASLKGKLPYDYGNLRFTNCEQAHKLMTRNPRDKGISVDLHSIG